MKPVRVSRIARFYLDAPMVASADLELPKPSSHHLISVLRARQGDTIELFNGDGNNYTATLIDTGQQSPGKKARLHIQSQSRANTTASVSITLAQAISRGDKMDSTIRQCVELGVSHIQPLYSRHSVKALDEKRTTKKQAHWHSIIVSACEQSGRATLPSLSPPESLSQWIQQTITHTDKTTTAPNTSPPDSTHIILSPTAASSLSQRLSALPESTRSISIIVGPESGFDTDEINKALTGGAQDARFGQRILRTETAGVACTAVIQTLLGDMG